MGHEMMICNYCGTSTNNTQYSPYCSSACMADYIHRLEAKLETLEKEPEKKTPRGKLIVFEGADGTGKTTQADLTVSWLAKKGYEVFSTREPGSKFFALTRSLRHLIFPSYFEF